MLPCQADLPACNWLTWDLLFEVHTREKLESVRQRANPAHFLNNTETYPLAGVWRPTSEYENVQQALPQSDLRQAIEHILPESTAEDCRAQAVITPTQPIPSGHSISRTPIASGQPQVPPKCRERTEVRPNNVIPDGAKRYPSRERYPPRKFVDFNMGTATQIYDAPRNLRIENPPILRQSSNPPIIRSDPGSLYPSIILTTPADQPGQPSTPMLPAV